MGSRVSPSWQQRLAAGEANWPTAGQVKVSRREGTEARLSPAGPRTGEAVEWTTAHPPSTPGLAR